MNKWRATILVKIDYSKMRNQYSISKEFYAHDIKLYASIVISTLQYVVNDVHHNSVLDY